MGKLELGRDRSQFSKNICWILHRIFDTQAKNLHSANAFTYRQECGQDEIHKAHRATGKSRGKTNKQTPDLRVTKVREKKNYSFHP